MPEKPGESASTDVLFPAVYDELKRIARRQRHAGGAPPTVCTTELVHEAFLRLARRGDPWDDRAHFFGAASRAMRQVLVDFARRRRAAKRGGEWSRVSLSDGDGALDVELDEVLAIDAALEQLEAVDRRLRQVVELRFFAGVPEQELAQILGVSARTVERDWIKARLFLVRELDPRRSQGGPPGGR
jgi:RNA polymerase sigma factor (TIGR02999 family)